MKMSDQGKTDFRISGQKLLSPVPSLNDVRDRYLYLLNRHGLRDYELQPE